MPSTKHVITIDFETYYDSEYTLTKMPMAQYITDNRFDVIGVSYRLDDAPAVWVSNHADVYEALWALPWYDATCVAHNAMFDAGILAWRYGLLPKRFFCTAQAARALFATAVGSVSLAKLVEYIGLGEKGTEVHNAKGMRLSDFTEEQLAEYGEYCKNDVNLTWLLYQLLSTWYGREVINVTK